MPIFILPALLIATSALLPAQYLITSTAGSGLSGGFSGDGGPARSAQLYNPQGAAVDAAGNIYFADANNYRVRKIAPNGVISTIAGTGVRGTSGDGGQALSANLGFVEQVAVNNNGLLCFGDQDAAKVRCMSLNTGIINGFGNRVPGPNPLGDGGHVADATFGSPVGVAFDAARNLYIADFAFNNVRRVDAVTNIVTTFAGTGSGYYGAPSGDGGPATAAIVYQPMGVQVANGGLYIMDQGNNRVRRVDLATNIITTVAGNGASFPQTDGVLATSSGVTGRWIAVDPVSGSIFIHGNKVRMVDGAGIITTLAGSGNTGIAQEDILATNAAFGGLTGLAWDPVARRVLISDGGNNRIRQVYLTPMTTTVLNAPANGTTTQPVTLEAVVNPATATGLVRFYVGATMIGTAPVSGGTATFPWTVTATGAHNVRAVYGGDANWNLSQSSVVTVSIKNGTSTSLTMNTGQPMLGFPVPFIATVTPSTTFGNVEFRDNGTLIGTVALSGGTASLQPTFPLGAHSVTATFVGDATTASSTSNTVSFRIKSSLAFNHSTNPNPSTMGQAVTFTATTTATDATGTIEFRDNGVALGTAPLVNGVATFSSAALTAGTHSINITYSGDDNYLSAGTSSNPHTVKVNTAAAVTASVNPSVVGQAVTFNVNVTPATASGIVLLNDGATQIASITLVNGAGSFTTSTLTAGSHPITAAYGGDALTNASTSPVLTQTVRIATATTLTSNRNPANRGQNVTFTARVTPVTAGQVEFYDGTTLVATRTLNTSGVATYSVSNWTVGAHAVTARYVGSATHAPSVSPVLTQTIR